MPVERVRLFATLILGDQRVRERRPDFALREHHGAAETHPDQR